MAKLFYALVLVTVQAAALSHDHADFSAPAGAAGQVCEFCTSHPAAAPPPATQAAAVELPAPVRHAPGYAPEPPRSHPACAGLSRAPPVLRSI